MGRGPRPGTQSTVDQRRRRHEATGAWWPTGQSVASGRSGAQELTGGGGKGRGERGGLIASLTRARVAVKWRRGQSSLGVALELRERKRRAMVGVVEKGGGPRLL
jgi:hypothetical protein